MYFFNFARSFFQLCFVKHCFSILWLVLLNPRKFKLCWLSDIKMACFFVFFDFFQLWLSFSQLWQKKCPYTNQHTLPHIYWKFQFARLSGWGAMSWDFCEIQLLAPPLFFYPVSGKWCWRGFKQELASKSYFFQLHQWFHLILYQNIFIWCKNNLPAASKNGMISVSQISVPVPFPAQATQISVITFFHFLSQHFLLQNLKHKNWSQISVPVRTDLKFLCQCLFQLVAHKFLCQLLFQLVPPKFLQGGVGGNQREGGGARIACITTKVWHHSFDIGSAS